MRTLPFHSRDEFYKSIFGSIAAGSSLRLRLLLHENENCIGAALLLKNDETENTVRFDMQRTEQAEGGFWIWECTVEPLEGLYWYSFVITTTFGERSITRSESGEGMISSNGTQWQLTVYDADYKTPDSFAGGIIYQIFPDRFYKKDPDLKLVPEDRFLRDDWGGTPEHRQHGEKRSLGNDYFMGTLKGITEKLPYIKSLGVTCIYLNPIFEAHSNHRYNTADYLKIDPLLGSEEDFTELCSEARKRNIVIILDGVFSHTGDDSIYFNKYKRYGGDGAYFNQSSPFYSWYKFNNWPIDYHSWWGVPSLPELNENDPHYTEFITGENGVLRHWMRLGAMGWRLDVADELPDEFLDKIRSAIKSENKDAFLLGEVWEDATNKISYCVRRRFLRGKQLDSVMNYPLSAAIISFLNGGNAYELNETVLSILENYPPESVKLLMNHIGTHDTARILTVFGNESEKVGSRDWQAVQKLTPEEYAHGIKFLKLAAVLQYTLPGIPSLYYGDEAGSEGYSDPFCRGCFPWGTENHELLGFYRRLGEIRTGETVFQTGSYEPYYAGTGHIVYSRKCKDSEILVAVNRWCDDEVVSVPSYWNDAEVLLGSLPENGQLSLPAEGACILRVGFTNTN